LPKIYPCLQDYHDSDKAIEFRKYEADKYRIGLLSETSSDVTFTATNRIGLVLDLSGTARHLTRMDGIFDETPTRRGDVCLIPPGIEARFAWEVKSARQTSITLEFDPVVLADYLPDFDKDRLASGQLVPSSYADRPILANLARLLCHEIDPAKSRGRLFADSVVRLVAVEIGASHWSAPTQPARDWGGSDPRINQAIAYIESRYSADISLADISQACGLSLTQLTERFRKATGVTPYSYVINRRLRQAVHLLKATDMPIAGVAVETGFADQQHLTRAFRARLRLTPGQVRVK
jgi:AraC family transcriptional regulator